MKKIRFYISSEELRQVCIDNDFFTRGDSRAYERLLNETRYPLNQLQLLRISKKIRENTDESRFEGYSEEELIESVSTLVMRKAIARIEEV